MAVRFSYKDLKSIKKIKNQPEQKKVKRKSSENKDNNLLFCKWINQEFGLNTIVEHRFHPKRMWRFDVAIPEIKLAIEVEGGVWIHGRHTRGSGFINDMEKYNSATSLGWRLLRCTPDHLLSSKFFNIVEKTIKTIT